MTFLPLLLSCASGGALDERVGGGSLAAPRATVSEGARAQVDPIGCALDGVGADAWTFAWQVDGEDFAGMTLATTHVGDTVFPGYTREGQVWTCTVRAYVAGAQVAEASAEAVIGSSADLQALDPLLAPVAWLEGVDTVHYAGALADSAAVSVTGGVDGWANRAHAPGARTGQYATGPFYAMSVTDMTPAEDGWTAQVLLPDGARAVHMVFGDGDTTDDADGHQYTWDLEFPSVGPYLTWNDVAGPSNGIVVNWASGQPGYGLVEYGPDEDHVAYVTGKTVETLHHVALAGLPAGETFVYRVRDAAGRTSPWSTFRTADLDEDTYTFLVASDMQDTGSANERWATIVAEMVAASPDARFVLAPGDLPADDYPGLWWIFFDEGRELFDHVPLVPSMGNHDDPGVESSDDSTSWQYWFDLPATPGSETYWRLDYGRTRILTINTEVASQLTPGQEQYAWMEEEALDLVDGDARSADWALAAFHIPAYDAGGRFAINTRGIRPLTELFDGAIDAVIAGHEHIYQRFQPVKYDGTLAPSGEYGLGPDDGVLYLVTPAAGYANLFTDMVGPDDAGGEQLDLLAWPELGGHDDEHGDDDDDQGQGDEHRSPNASGNGENVDAIQGYLVADVTPDTLTFSFIGMGNSEEPDSASVQDTVTIRR